MPLMRHRILLINYSFMISCLAGAGGWPARRRACRSRRWRSNQSGKCSQARLTRGTVTSTVRRAAHPSGGARCGAGTSCSAMKYRSLAAGAGAWTARRRACRVLRIDHFSKSQFRHKIVNLLYTKLIVYDKLTILWESRLYKAI